METFQTNPALGSHFLKLDRYFYMTTNQGYFETNSDKNVRERQRLHLREDDMVIIPAATGMMRYAKNGLIMPCQLLYCRRRKFFFLILSIANLQQHRQE